MSGLGLRGTGPSAEARGFSGPVYCTRKLSPRHLGRAGGPGRAPRSSDLLGVEVLVRFTTSCSRTPRKRNIVPYKENIGTFIFYSLAALKQIVVSG